MILAVLPCVGSEPAPSNHQVNVASGNPQQQKVSFEYDRTACVVQVIRDCCHVGYCVEKAG